MKARSPVRPEMRARLALGAFALLLLTGCEHLFSSEAPPPPPPKPAVISKPAHVAPSKPAFSASPAGPLKLAMVGGYMDAQEKDFRSRLRGVLVMRPGDDIIVL